MAIGLAPVKSETWLLVLEKEIEVPGIVHETMKKTFVGIIIY